MDMLDIFIFSIILLGDGFLLFVLAGIFYVAWQDTKGR